MRPGKEPGSKLGYYGRRIAVGQVWAPQENGTLIRKPHAGMPALASCRLQTNSLARAALTGDASSAIMRDVLALAKGKPMTSGSSRVCCALALALTVTLIQDRAAFAQTAPNAQRGEQQTAAGLQARQSDGSFAPVSFDPATAPFGLRNNNWAGLKGPNLSGRWPGQTGANPQGFARFDDPAYGVRAFVDLIRQYHDRHELRSAAAILRRYSPAGDCSGAPSIAATERREGGGCPENETTPPVTAIRVARAVGLQPNDNLELFGRDGSIRHPDRLRVLLDGVITQEIGPSHCPQPPRNETWIGCRVDDGVYNQAVELLQRPN